MPSALLTDDESKQALRELTIIKSIANFGPERIDNLEMPSLERHALALGGDILAQQCHDTSCTW